MNRQNSYRGVVHGNVVQLDQAPNLPDAQMVSVSLEPVTGREASLRRAFGSWAEDSEGLDEFLEQIRRDRHADRREQMAMSFLLDTNICSSSTT